MSIKHSLSYPRIVSSLIKNDCWDDIQKNSKEQWIIPVFFEGLNFDGTSNKDEVNLFNDLAVLIDIRKQIIIRVWNCTTEPGWKFRQKPLNSDGWALISFGYQRCWVKGSHNKQFPALIQTGGIVEVFRNKSSNGNRKTGKIFKGFFGINIHTTNDDDVDYDVKVVNGWSAGCIVLANSYEFYNEFMEEVLKNTCKVFGIVVLPEIQY